MDEMQLRIDYIGAAIAIFMTDNGGKVPTAAQFKQWQDEAKRYAAAEMAMAQADYDETINDFLAGTGRY
jgi:hypothetical protein